MAWRIAALAARAMFGKLPDVRLLLSELKQVQGRPTVGQQRAMMGMLSERYGVPLKPISAEAIRALVRLGEREAHG